MGMPVIAVYSISNTAVIQIYKIEYGLNAFVIAGLNNSNPKRYKLYIDRDKKIYFNMSKVRIYIDQCIRTGY